MDNNKHGAPVPLIFVATVYVMVGSESDTIRNRTKGLIMM